MGCLPVLADRPGRQGRLAPAGRGTRPDRGAGRPRANAAISDDGVLAGPLVPTILQGLPAKNKGPPTLPVLGSDKGAPGTPDVRRANQAGSLSLGSYKGFPSRTWSPTRFAHAALELHQDRQAGEAARPDCSTMRSAQLLRSASSILGRELQQYSARVHQSKLPIPELVPIGCAQECKELLFLVHCSLGYRASHESRLDFAYFDPTSIDSIGATKVVAAR